MIVRLKKQCKIDIFPKGKLFPEVKIPMGKKQELKPNRGDVVISRFKKQSKTSICL